LSVLVLLLWHRTSLYVEGLFPFSLSGDFSRIHTRRLAVLSGKRSPA